MEVRPSHRFVREGFIVPAGGIESLSRPLRGRRLELNTWVLLEQVAQPGAFVRRGTGDLIRITPSGGVEEGSERIVDRHEDDEPVYVTKISSDPFIPISQARIAAANRDLDIDF